jgi:thiamine pyrophosphate-dependent acetolactate synthase large subunit-like protein
MRSRQIICCREPTQDNYIASKFDSQLDFAAIGRQFGIRSIALSETIDPVKTIELMLKKKGPCIIDVTVH